MTTLEAAAVVDSWTDAELLAFVAERLPKLLWRARHKPRCAIIRPAIIAALLKTSSAGDSPSEPPKQPSKPKQARRRNARGLPFED